MVIGITGGIASGKSNVCSVIRAHGYKIIDCDKISYLETLKGGRLYEAIIKGFGASILDSNLEIDRKALGRIIFSSKEKRELLDSITHPIILEEVKRQIKELKEELIFVEVPLLYEAKFDSICDYVICVYLKASEQIKRLMAREGIDREYAKSKIASQMSLEKKKELSDFVIDSSGSFAETKKNIEKVLERIEKECI